MENVKDQASGIRGEARELKDVQGCPSLRDRLVSVQKHKKVEIRTVKGAGEKGNLVVATIESVLRNPSEQTK